MKKVLFMLSSMNIGGVEKSLLSLLGVLPKEKYDITILLLNKSGGFLNNIPDGIKVEEASWFENIKPIIFQSPYKTIKNYLKKYKFIKAIRFGVIHKTSTINNDRYSYYQNILKDVPNNDVEYDVAVSYAGPTEIIDSYIANKVKAKKKIAWVHFDVSKHIINEKLYTRLYKCYDKVFTVSNEAKEKLVSRVAGIEEKTEVFLNIISKELIEEMASEEQEVQYDESFTNIVTVGRLSKEKGQDIAIEVMNLLKKDGEKVRWYCIGEGSSREEYESLIKEYNLEDDFILVGATPNPYPYIKNADIYVQTSIHEGYCLTLAEAKVLKKPIITTDFTGALEQIEDKVNGVIIKRDKEVIYKEIKNMIDCEGLKEKYISKLNSEDFYRDYNIEDIL